MKADPREIGRVVISKQGHDKGKAYVVTAVLDERYVLLCDGAARRLEKPKKKQAKHLRALPQLVEEIAGALLRDHAGEHQKNDIPLRRESLSNGELHFRG